MYMFIWGILCVCGVEKGVRQDYFVHIVHSMIVRKFRVDVEENWHLDVLFRSKSLFFKTKALYFVKVLGSSCGYNAIRGHADDFAVCRVVGAIERQRTLSRPHSQVLHLGLEFPRHC